MWPSLRDAAPVRPPGLTLDLRVKKGEGPVLRKASERATVGYEVREKPDAILRL